MKLHTFLRERLADDKTLAQAQQQWSPHWYYDDTAREVRDQDNHGTVAFVPGHADGAHMARHDPARTLLEVDAQLRLVDELAAVSSGDWIDAGEEVLADRALRLLALPYADHPDYHHEWSLH